MRRRGRRKLQGEWEDWSGLEKKMATGNLRNRQTWENEVLGGWQTVRERWRQTVQALAKRGRNDICRKWRLKASLSLCALERSTLLGKVLRIDVDNNDDGPPYSIPSDNPFVMEKESRAGKPLRIFFTCGIAYGRSVNTRSSVHQASHRVQLPWEWAMSQGTKVNILLNTDIFKRRLEATTDSGSHHSSQKYTPLVSVFAVERDWELFVSTSRCLSVSLCRDLCLRSSQHVALLHRPRGSHDGPRPREDVLWRRRSKQIRRGGPYY